MFTDSCSSSIFHGASRRSPSAPTKPPEQQLPQTLQDLAAIGKLPKTGTDDIKTLQELAAIGKLPKSENDENTRRDADQEPPRDNDKDASQPSNDLTTLDSNELSLQPHNCDPDFDKSYCLHGKCRSVAVSDITWIHCECDKGYIGERCELKHPEIVSNRKWNFFFFDFEQKFCVCDANAIC